MSDEYDVFLSHAHDDEPKVEALAQRLRTEADLQPYLRRWMLIPGEQWVPAIEQAIECSTTVAVFFGPGGSDAWRDQESQLALIDQSKSRIIPVLLPGASTQNIDGFLRARTWVDLAENDGFERLIAGVTGQAPELINGFDPGPKLRKRLGESRRAGWPETTRPARPTPYRVFLSSALDEDQQRRERVLETIEEVGMVVMPQDALPKGAGAAALEARRTQLEGCDLLLVLVSWRYGQVPQGHDRSLIELEYEWAVEQGIPRLIFLVDEQRPIVVEQEFDPLEQRWSKQTKLQALKARLEAAEATIRFTPDNVGAKVTHNLHQWRNEGAMTTVPARPSTSEPSVSQDDDQDEKTRVMEVADPPSNDKPAETKQQRAPRKRRTRSTSNKDLSDYLEFVESDSATTTMFGPSAPIASPLRLDDLRVKVQRAHHRCGTDDETDETDEPEPESDFELHQIFEHAEHSGSRVVVLVGPPGSGKSTHLRRIALWLSRRSPKTLGLPIDTVPIMLPLHDLPPEIEDLHEAIAAHLRRDPRIEAPLIDTLLRRKHLLFLVDGFDELPSQERRDRVTQWIDQGLRDHPQARFLVTQRPLEPGSKDRWSVPVLEVQLSPLAEPEARALIDRWFRASSNGGVNATEAKHQADTLWAQLKTPEFRAARMFELARNPLMLTVLCAVFRHRGGLPTRRVELYEQCLQVLIHQWRNKGELPRRFGDREARQVLQPLAYWLHTERGRTHANARSIAVMLEPHLVAALGYEPIDGEAFVRGVSAGDGILTSKGGDSYGLLHLGMQEYLCARHLRSLSHGDPKVLDDLSQHFGDPWWREVTVLLLALGEPALFEPMMRLVMDRATVADHVDWIVDCVHEAAGATLEPFVALLTRDLVDQPERWPSQLAAAQVLQRVAPEKLSELGPQILEHPFEPLRSLVTHEQRPQTSARVSLKSGYPLVLIPKGHFVMGSHPRERGRRGSEGPRHEVELAPFFMGAHPVTNEEYGHYLRLHSNAPEPKYWGDPRYNQPRQPVVGVSWHEAMNYCEWAGLSLPTEAQWERAARGDTRTAYWSGREEADLARVGWYASNSEQRLHPVGELDANPLGLHDVHGNVWEWCLDEFGDYKGRPPRAGDGLRHPPLDKGNRVIRGGSWIDPARKARSAYRLNRNADNRLAYLGFRAIEPEELDG